MVTKDTVIKCQCCGREFAPQRSTARFCSGRCRLKNHRPSMRKRYNDLVGRYNTLFDVQAEVIGNLNKLIGTLLKIADEPNKAKRARLNSITLHLMKNGWFEAQLAKKAEKPTDAQPAP